MIDSQQKKNILIVWHRCMCYNNNRTGKMEKIKKHELKQMLWNDTIQLYNQISSTIHLRQSSQIDKIYREKEIDEIWGEQQQNIM